ncbi:hypothetical protein DRP04_06060 [Archaeoglobales archaeon]|nr:MAG: hypothetical protein DRP04_06060 [Archaeoglobales archaeon]
MADDEPLVVFIDESGQASIKDKETKYFSVCAAISSEFNAHSATQFLRKLIVKHFGIIKPGIHEIHAHELVNPRGDSLWRKVPLSVRGEIVKEFLEKMIALNFTTITVLVKKQYIERELSELRKSPKVLTKYIAELGYGLLFERIFLEIKRRGKVFFVVIDEGGKNKQFIENLTNSDFSPYLKPLRKDVSQYLLGIGLSPSFLHAGMQLADTVAYFWRRIYEDKLREPFKTFVDEKLEKLAIKSPSGDIYGYGIKIWG